MPTLSNPDQATCENLQYKVKRRLLVAPRTALFKAQINGTPVKDAITKGYIQVSFDNVTLGSVGVIEPDMSIDFGTTSGARDIGTVRVRSASGTIIKIAETAPGNLPGLADNMFITVVDEFRLWSIAPRLVATRTNGVVTGFTAYRDYEKAYTNQHVNLQPLVNVVAEPAGEVDSGQTFRTVNFTVTTQVMQLSGASPSNPTLDVKDGTITVGPSHSTSGLIRTTTFTATFPQATFFRHVKITGNDTAGNTSIRRFPIWVIGTTQGFTKVLPVRDDTVSPGGGRMMNFELFGGTNEYNEAALPVGTLICYYEKVTFGTAAAPTLYRESYLGWTTQQATTLKVRNKGRLLIETAGPDYWLDKMRGWSVTVSEKTTPTKWDELNTLNNDRWTYIWLRDYTTFLNLFNLNFSLLTRRAQAEKVNKGSIWKQMERMNEGYALTRLGCDTLGNLWMMPEYSLLTGAERTARGNLFGITAANWFDARGLNIPDDYVERVGQLTAAGSIWDGESNAQKKAAAPGRTPGQSNTGQEAEYQRLPVTDGHNVLMQFAGDRFEMENNPRTDVSFELIHNLDVIEPCYNQPIGVTWSATTITGLTLTSQRFMPKRVSIRHSNKRGELPKRIIVTCDQVTQGSAGQAVFPTTTTNPTSSPSNTDTPDNLWGDIFTPPATLPPNGLNPVYGQGAIALFQHFRKIRRTSDFYTNADLPTFDSVDLQAAGMAANETLEQFMVDASSFGSGQTHGWIGTNLKLWRVTNIFGTPVITNQLTKQIYNFDIDFTHPGDVGKFGVALVPAVGPATGVDVYVTVDGATWTFSKNFPSTSVPAGIYPGLFIDPHVAGQFWLFGKDTGDTQNYLYRGNSYGASYTKIASVFDTTRAGVGAAMPFQDGDSERVFFTQYIQFVSFQLMRGTIGTGMTAIPMSYAGTLIAPRTGRWGISIPNSNRNTLWAAVTADNNGPKGVVRLDNVESASPIVNHIYPTNDNNAGYSKVAALDPDGVRAILMGGTTGYYAALWNGYSLIDRSPSGSGTDPIIGVCGNGG